MNHILEVEELEIMNDKLREKSYKECLLTTPFAGVLIPITVI